MAEYRIVYYDGNIVRFSYKDYAEGGKISDITMKVHSFIGRLIRHIPDKYLPMIRYAGLFAKRWKKPYVSRCRIALNQPEPDDTDANRHQSWAQRQEQSTGIDPLRCPICDQPLTFAAMLLGNRQKLQDIFDTAGKDAGIAPPLLKPG